MPADFPNDGSDDRTPATRTTTTTTTTTDEGEGVRQRKVVAGKALEQESEEGRTTDLMSRIFDSTKDLSAKRMVTVVSPS